MLFGRKNIVASEKHGMLEIHMQALSQAARKTNYIYIVRNVSLYAKDAIEEGCLSKPFGVDVKSCKIGPFAGYFPMDPHYSHVAEKERSSELDKIAKAMKVNNKFNTVPLVLKEKRIKWLQSKGLLTAIQSGENFVLEWKKEETTIQAIAVKVGPDLYQIQDDKGEPLMALGQSATVEDRETLMPLTADYDLFGVLVETKKLDPGKADHTPLSTQQTLDEEFERAKDSKDSGPKEDPRKGNVSKRMRGAIEHANEAIRAFDSKRVSPELNMFHHNAEIASPKAADISKSLPLILFLPLDSKQEESAVVLIETEEAAIAARKMIRDAGFYWPAHKRYQTQFPAFDSSQMSLLTNPRNTRERHVPKNQDEKHFLELLKKTNESKQDVSTRDSIRKQEWWALEFNNAQREEKKIFNITKTVALESLVSVKTHAPEETVPASVSQGSPPSGSVVLVPTPEDTTERVPQEEDKETTLRVDGRTTVPSFRPRQLTVADQKVFFVFTGRIKSSGSGRDEKLMNLYKELTGIMNAIEQGEDLRDTLIASLVHKYNDLSDKISRYNYKSDLFLSQEDYTMLTTFQRFIQNWAKIHCPDITLKQDITEKPVGRKVASWFVKNKKAFAKKAANFLPTQKTNTKR